MPTASPLRLPLLGALLATQLAAHAAPPVAVSFDTTPRAGQHQRQQIDMRAVMNMRVEAAPDATEEQRAKIAQAAERMNHTGPIKMAMHMQQTMKVDAADATGWLPMTVSMATLGGSMEVGGNTIPLPKEKIGNMSFDARFNPKDFGFEVKKFEGGSPELAEAMGKQGKAMIAEALQLYKALSQRPLTVGESVEVPLTMALPMPLPGGTGGMESKVRYTLARVEKGIAYFDLGMDLKMNIKAPPPAKSENSASAPPALAASAAQIAETTEARPQPFLMKMTGSGKGTSSLRLSDRLPLASQLTMTMQMTMNGPDNGRMFMDMEMDMQSKGESLAQRGAAKKKP